MKRFKPVYGLLIVPLFLLLVVFADHALSGGLSRGYERVSPDAEGVIRLDLADLERSNVRFFRFLNAGNQEVKFLVGRDQHGVIHAAFDASETDYKRKRGFRHEGDWLVNNKCDTTFRLAEVNSGQGGCRPVPLAHQLQGDTMILRETDILAGWRYFR